MNPAPSARPARRRILAGGLLGALALAGPGPAVAGETTFDSGQVTVVAATRAVRVDVGGLAVVSVDKVSNPGVRVRVSASEGSVPVASVTHAPGENSCSAADDPARGTLNRTYRVQGGGTATVYLAAQFTTTTPIGVSTTTVLEPLGPSGTTLAVPADPTGLPVSVCVA